MPDVLTHILFAQNVKDAISDINVKDAIDNNMQLYNFGAQGPDFLFYHISPLLVDRRVPAAGAMMHRIETSKFFKDFVLWLENLNGAEYEQNLAYFAGFLTHFYCDKTIHPYVEATVEKGASYFHKNGGKAYLSHYMVEYVMDIRLWKEHTGTEAYKQDILQLIGTEPLPYEIVRYITEFINFTQPNAVTKNEVYNASIKMRQIHKILYDPKNMKKWWINLLPMPRKCYVEKAKEDIDVLNLNKRIWNHVQNDDEKSDSSVEDLMKVGCTECVKCLDEISEMLEKGIGKDLNKLIPDVSYLTNKPI
jgi:hypothetical protein